MKIVMTLLARDEADIVDAQVAFHLNLGVDFVIATDNRSVDGTAEILARYERDGVLRLIHESGDDLKQSEWVTRMARLAAEEHDADWIFNTDADEFWLPRAPGGFREIVQAIPDRFGVVRGAWRNFVPRPETAPLFAERMTVRMCTPSYLDDPMATVFKALHRADPRVRVGRGNHEVFGDRLLPLRGWYPIEILHFPVRSREQCRRKYVTQFLALARNPAKGTPGQIVEAYRADEAGRFDEFYEPLILHDDDLETGLATGDLVVDTRLRDILRNLAIEAGSGRRFRLPWELPRPVDMARPPLDDDALFASEVTVIPESDFASYADERVGTLEARIGRLERRGGAFRRPASLLRRGAGR